MKKRILISICTLTPILGLTASALSSCGSRIDQQYYYVDCDTDGNGILVGKTQGLVVGTGQKFSDFSWKLPSAQPNSTYEFWGWFQGTQRLNENSILVGQPGKTVVLTAHFLKTDHYNVTLKSTGASIVSGQQPKIDQDANIVIKTNHIYFKFDTSSLLIKVKGKEIDSSKFSYEENFDQLSINIPKENFDGDIEITIKTKLRDMTIIKDFSYHPVGEQTFTYMISDTPIKFEQNKLYLAKIDLSMYESIPETINISGGSLFTFDNNWQWLKFYDEVVFVINQKVLDSNQYAIQPTAGSMNGNFQIKANDLIKEKPIIYFAFIPKQTLNNGQVSFFIE